MLDPIESASQIFHESLMSLMAHAIRGTQNHFRNHNLTLQLLVVAPKKGTIPLSGPGDGTTSILQTALIKNKPDYLPAIVKATIYIHREANRHLARVCVAHELFHLLMELAEFEKNGRMEWPKISPSKEVEDQCNQFAWELCRSHDKFYRDEKLREELIYFPEHMFDSALNIDPKHQDEWPTGLALDPEHPFYKKQYLW